MLVDRSVAWLTQKINVILFTIHTTCSKYVVCTNMVVHENPNQPIKAKGKKFLFKEKKYGNKILYKFIKLQQYTYIYFPFHLFMHL